jgi:hypothetical protein
MHAEEAKKDFTRYSVNDEFNRAALFFRDESFIEFEHTSRDNRWARASADGTIADKICRSIRIFRLNAKHLQLFFEDGTDAEFIKNERLQ